jgi:hypothetical protein
MSKGAGTGLWAYAAHTVILRKPAEQLDRVVCPECGCDIERTKGTGDARVPIAALVDAELAAALDVGDLPTHGWVCTRHSNYTVVCPADPEALHDAWTSILVEMADGHVRDVPIPAPEVDVDGE